MIITSCYAYEGRNIYAHLPVIRIEIDLEEYFNTPTKDIAGFNERLLQLLPGLMEHQCTKGFVGGFALRLEEGTYFAHVIEHMAIEIQNTIGYEIKYGKARQTANEKIYNVIYSFENKIAGIEAGKLAVDIVNSLILGESIEIEKRISDIKSKSNNWDLGSSTAAIKKEAEARNIPVIRLGNGSLLQLGYGINSRKIEATITENTSCISVDTASDKTLAKDLMWDFGIPVPIGKIVNSEQEAMEYSEKIGYPVVVKPNFGSHGDGVSINLRNPQEVLDAYKIAKEIEGTVLVEKFIKGNHYRILVIGDQLVAASNRIAARVIGDGFSNIGTLIDKENMNPLRGVGHEKPLTKIVIDKVVENYLKKLVLDISYVPEKNEIIYLRENDNLSTGGTAIDVTDIIHEENKRMSILAAKVIGLDVAGIDMTITDITKPMREVGGAIIEINAAPGIRMHHYPAEGKPRNAAKAIVDMICPNDSCYTIPIVSVTGTNGKTTTTRMIANIIHKMGAKVGMTTTSGIYIDGECIKKGDNTGPVSARTVLMDKSVEYAVLETARGGILKKGLGYDIADVGIVTNITEDHLGIDGVNTLEELAYVKSLVVEAVKSEGNAVLNADDKYCVGMKEYIKSKIIFYSIDSENPVITEHVSNGGIAVYYKDEYIFINNAGTEKGIMKVSDIPATLNGVIEHNIYNSMAAISGAVGLGIDHKYIIEGLSSFSCDYNSNPGRFNIHDVNGIKVVIDYGHNIDGYRVVINSLKKLKEKKLIGIIGVPGDRTNSSTLTVGELCGNSFDRIFIKEDRDRRGKGVGEIAEILKAGCLKGSIDPNEVFIEHIEEKALELALMSAEEGDIIVVFYEEYEPLIEVIQRVRLQKEMLRLITA